MTMMSSPDPAVPSPRSSPALVAQSLTTGEIPADISGETTDDDLLFNTSSGMDDSADEPAETTFEDSAGYFDEEVIEEDTEEYDEEEIVDEDDMVEEVIDSEHASDHDLVEEEVVEGADESEKLPQISEGAMEEDEDEEVVEATEHSEGVELAGEEPGAGETPVVDSPTETPPEPTVVVEEQGHVSSTNLESDPVEATASSTGDKLQQSSSSVAMDEAVMQESSATMASQLQEEQGSSRGQLLHGSNHEPVDRSSASLAKAEQSSSSVANENHSSMGHELQGSTVSDGNEPPPIGELEPSMTVDTTDGERTGAVLPVVSSESDTFFESGSPSSKGEESQDELMGYVTVDDAVASPVSHSRPSADAQSLVAAESLMVGSAVLADDSESKPPQQQAPVVTTGDVRRPPSPKITRSAWMDEEEPSDEGGGRFDEAPTVASIPPSVPTINEGDELSNASDHPSVQGANDLGPSELSTHSLMPTQSDHDHSEASIASSPTAPQDAGPLESSMRSASSAPAYQDGPDGVSSAPGELHGAQDSRGSIGNDSTTVPIFEDDQPVSTDEPSERSAADDAGVPYIQKESFEDQKETSRAFAVPAFYGGDNFASDPDNEGETEEDAPTRNDVETAIDYPPYDKKMYDADEEDAVKDEAPRRKLRSTDIVLVACIVVVFLVLVITLPVVLTNQKKNRNAPTNQPSPSAPTSSPSSYALVGGPFQGPTGSLLGNAVSLHGSLAVAGLPGTTPGSIFTFQKASTGTARNLRRVLEGTNGMLWTQVAQVLQGQEPGDMFGWSLSLYNNGMVVGAPGTLANGTNVAAGAAYYYELSADAMSWNQVGTAIRGEEDLFAVNEMFGSSVSQGGDHLLVVGASNRNGGDGAVYTFSLDQTTMDWSRIASTGLISNNASGEGLGSAVSLSFDGGRMVAGAPGAYNNSGRALAYQWDTGNSEWTQVADLPGNVGEYFGASAVCLSPSCGFFAVGGPGANGWSGVIRVYKVDSSSLEISQFGADIAGTKSGEGLGSPGSISGSVDKDHVTVFAGTTDGRVYRFVSTGGGWVDTIGPIETGVSQPITGVSSDDQALNVLVGAASADAVAVYSVASSNEMAPTSPPVASPASTSPSPSATSTPPPGLTWTLSNTFASDQGSNLGVSVALVSLLMAAGATSGAGYVNVYQRAGSGWAFQVAINGTEQSSRFGEAIDFNPSDGGLLVGAPGTLATGTSTPQGAAHYYSFASSAWTPLGGAIRGDTDVYAANEDFGYSVSVSGQADLAIGAPRSSFDNVIERGRVYTFTFDTSSSSWVRKGSNSSTVGAASSDLYGSSVAISADGGTLVVGAPGQGSGAGAIYVYTWDGADWSLIASFNGDASESLGDSVAILSTTDGSAIAGGGMRSNGGSGIVRVYQLQGGSYAPLGSPIVGAAGDGLGSPKSLSGSVDGIIAGTLGGDVKTFMYNSASGTWDQSSTVVSTGASAGLAISGSSALGSFVAGTSGDVQIYGLAET